MNIPFAISARTAHLIGMENFANAEGAIVELVKNAYDADADTCVVVADIRDAKNLSRIFIIDNGIGMTADTIINHWMTIGTDDKLYNARSSGKKRIKSGAKGIGRFALNRLGNFAEMLTLPESNQSKAYLWNVDWSKFDKARVLSEVDASLEEMTREAVYDKLRNYSIEDLPIYNTIFSENFHGTV